MTDSSFDLSGILGSDTSGAIGNAINTLLSRPDLINNIANELGLGNMQADRPSETAPEPRKTPESPKSEPPKTAKKSVNDKDKLLIALRPYLSPERQSAIDMMLKLDEIGSLVGNIDPKLLNGILSSLGKT